MKLRLSVRLLLGVMLVQLGMAVLLIWNNGRIIHENHISQLEKSYQREQVHLSHSISIGLLYSDRAMLAESISHLLQDKDFHYALVYDYKQRIMASLGELPSELSDITSSHSLADALVGGIYRLSTDVVKEGRTLGRLVVAYRTESITHFVAQAKQQNLLIAAAILGLTAVVSFLLFRYITSSLRLVEYGAREFSRGNLAYRIDAADDKAIDDVAVAFNELAVNLQQTIHSLQLSEERFRQLAENINQVFWLGSPDWNRVDYVSPAYEKVWGKSVESLYENPRSWFDAVHPDDRENVIQDVPREVSEIKGVIEFREYRVQGRDGRYRWVKARAYPIYEDGVVVRVAGIAEDITERKRIEAELRQSQKLDALGKLTGGVAHDYNNILGIVSGYSDVLSMKLGADEKMQEYVKQIKHASERGAKLTKKLLSFSKNSPYHSEDVDLNRILLEQEDMLKKTLTPRIELEYRLAESVGAVRVDVHELETAVVNICINAMQAMSGGGKIIIATMSGVSALIGDGNRERAKKGKPYVKLSISDNGCGMDETTKERIFEPFFTTKGLEGNGLGLSQVYGFVAQSDGEIAVESFPGGGTTISLYFPRHEPDVDAAGLSEGVRG